MERSHLAKLRAKKHWTLEEASERIGVSVNTLSRWEHGIQSPHGYNLQRLCDAYGISETEAYGNSVPPDVSTGLVNVSPLTELWADDLLTIYARGIAACYNLYFEGSPHQVEEILPLYRYQTTVLARRPSSVQHAAAILASQAQQLTCERWCDRLQLPTATRDFLLKRGPRIGHKMDNIHVHMSFLPNQIGLEKAHFLILSAQKRLRADSDGLLFS